MKSLVSLTPVKLLCLIAITLAVVGLLYQAFFNAPKLEQVDLRNRIVASRLLDTEYSPYHYTWKPGDDERLLNKREFTTEFYKLPVSFATVPPSMLILHKPLSDLGYLTIKKIWLWTQLILFILIVAWFTLQSKSKETQEKYWIIIAGSLFSITFIWDIHISVGQIYIIYPFILTIAYGLALKPQKTFKLASGFLIGISVLFRPAFAIFSLPLLANKKYASLLGMIIGIAMGILVFVVPNTTLWEQYSDSMKFWGNFNFIKNTCQENLPLPSWVPETVEGITAIDKPQFRGRIENTSIQYYIYRALDLKLSTKYLLGLFLIFTTGIIIFLKNRFLKLSMTNIFLLGACLMIVSDYFLPAPRMPYNAIQWLFPVLLVMKSSKIKFDHVTVLIFTGLILNLNSLPWLHLNMWLGELLMFAGMLLFLKLNQSEQYEINGESLISQE